jgi:hypothetical protein
MSSAYFRQGGKHEHFRKESENKEVTHYRGTDNASGEPCSS